MSTNTTNRERAVRIVRNISLACTSESVIIHMENLITAELDAKDAEIERLRAALEKIAEHHEDQANAWGGEEGDTNNVQYHSERARFANAAYDPPA